MDYPDWYYWTGGLLTGAVILVFVTSSWWGRLFDPLPARRVKLSDVFPELFWWFIPIAGFYLYLEEAENAGGRMTPGDRMSVFVAGCIVAIVCLVLLFVGIVVACARCVVETMNFFSPTGRRWIPDERGW